MAKNDTRTLIVEAAEELFYKHGFKRISVEDICRKIGVTRKTFYDHFNNKNEVIIEFFDKLFDAVMRRYLHIMDSDISFGEKMHQIIDMKLNSVGPELMDDILRSKDTFIQEYFERKTRESRMMVVDFYISTQKSGDIRNDIDMEVIIRLQQYLCELCKDVSFQALFKDETTMFRQVWDIYLYGVSGKQAGV